MTAREQFLIDLQKDQDYNKHKKNCQWKQEAYSPYVGYYTKDSGTYGVVNAGSQKIENKLIH